MRDCHATNFVSITYTHYIYHIDICTPTISTTSICTCMTSSLFFKCATHYTSIQCNSLHCIRILYNVQTRDMTHERLMNDESNGRHQKTSGQVTSLIVNIG